MNEFMLMIGRQIDEFGDRDPFSALSRCYPTLPFFHFCRLFNFTMGEAISNHPVVVVVVDGGVYFDDCSVLSSAFFSPSGIGSSSLGDAIISAGSSLFP